MAPIKNPRPRLNLIWCVTQQKHLGWRALSAEEYSRKGKSKASTSGTKKTNHSHAKKKPNQKLRLEIREIRLGIPEAVERGGKFKFRRKQT